MPPGKQWDRRRKAPRSRTLRRILILCEDSKSSRDYLAKFPFDPKQVEIDCVGTGMNTDSLMMEAIKRKQQALRAKEPYERIWVVFDRDSFPPQNFGRTFDLARAHREIVACWSNECFELWYLLHFCYRDTAIGRQEIWAEVSAKMGRKYDKADGEVFKVMAAGGRIEKALKNASRLEFENEQSGDPRRNPSTLVHKLIEALRALDPALQK